MTAIPARWLNLGCGDNKLPCPWENYDRGVDITKPLPWKDWDAQFILLEHTLEHVTGPEGYRFMKEAHRILCPGGILRICVPVLNDIADLKKREDLIINHGHLMVYSWESLSLMLEAAGFKDVTMCGRKECDGHWKVIGKELDDAETLRVEAIK